MTEDHRGSTGQGRTPRRMGAPTGEPCRTPRSCQRGRPRCQGTGSLAAQEMSSHAAALQPCRLDGPAPPSGWRVRRIPGSSGPWGNTARHRSVGSSWTGTARPPPRRDGVPMSARAQGCPVHSGLFASWCGTPAPLARGLWTAGDRGRHAGTGPPTYDVCHPAGGSPKLTWYPRLDSLMLRPGWACRPAEPRAPSMEGLLVGVVCLWVVL